MAVFTYSIASWKPTAHYTKVVHKPSITYVETFNGGIPNDVFQSRGHETGPVRGSVDIYIRPQNSARYDSSILMSVVTKKNLFT
jgi:hypothetical protein